MKRARLARPGLVVLLALGLLAPMTGTASADVGPDTFGYYAFTGLTSPYEDISATGTPILVSVDDSFAMVPIGFAFPFYGSIYTDVFVSSNGMLTFGAGNASFSNTDLLTSPGPAEPAIAPLWDDWITACNGVPDDAVYYQSSGDRLIVQWHVVRPFFNCAAGSFDFQVVLSGDGAIEFRYLDVVGGVANDFGASATVGIRDATSGGAPANGRVLQVSLNSPSITDGQAIRIENLGGGGGGGGGDTGGFRAPTSLELWGPHSAAAGEYVKLEGKLKTRRWFCRRDADITILQVGEGAIGTANTNGQGEFSFRAMFPAGASEATYKAKFPRNASGSKVCLGSASNLWTVAAE